MNMQGSNRFTVNKNRFSKPVNVEKTYSCIQLKKNFKSVNVEEHFFTNFSKSMASQKYILVKDIWEKYKNNLDITSEYLIADELINQKAKIERLQKIIFLNTGRNITNQDIVNNVFKFKHKKDVEIQFYFYYNGKSLNLLLIDIFHLGITALKNGNDIYEKKYKINKHNKCCLSNITRY